MFKFLRDERGFTNIIIGVVGLVITIILYTSVVLPIIIGANTSVSTRYYDSLNCGTYANTTCGAVYVNATHHGNLTISGGWPLPVIAMYGILPIALIGALVAMVVGTKM